MSLIKLNNKGNYTPFPGITVVASIRDKDADLWSSIYKILIKNREFTDHFAPLPYTSYHMTVINLWTEEAVGTNEWENFITRNQSFFQSLHQLLTETTFTPTLSIRVINLTETLQIIVTLPEEQKKIIQQIARSHHVELGIPPAFHITLAYQFNYIEKSHLEEIKLSLEREILQLLKRHTEQLALNYPQLCFFNDMTEFIPWNGEEFPFPESTNSSLSTFFSRK